MIERKIKDKPMVLVYFHPELHLEKVLPVVNGIDINVANIGIFSAMSTAADAREAAIA